MRAPKRPAGQLKHSKDGTNRMQQDRSFIKFEEEDISSYWTIKNHQITVLSKGCSHSHISVTQWPSQTKFIKILCRIGSKSLLLTSKVESFAECVAKQARCSGAAAKIGPWHHGLCVDRIRQPTLSADPLGCTNTHTTQV